MHVRLALLITLLGLLVVGCSSGPSAAVRNKQVCAAYEAFWDTSYSGGKPSPTMVARETKLLDAIARAPDKKLGAAAKAVVVGELSTPPLQSSATAKQYLSSNKYKSLAAVQPSDQFVESRCDQLGRHINA